MITQLAHVLRTYVSRRSLWLIGVFGLFSVGPSAALLMAGGGVDKVPPMIAAMGITFPAAIASYVLATQAKWQFCDARARLLPHFAGPHLAIVVALATAAFGLYPAVLTLSGRWSPLGVPACAIVIAAGSLWTIHSGNWVWGLAAFTAYLSLMTQPGLAFWIDADNARRFAPLHAALLVGGWAAIGAWLVRLARMREEDNDAFIPMQAQQGSATRLERTQSARAMARQMIRSQWMRRPSDWWHDRLRGFRAVTPRDRQRLLRYGVTPMPAWIPAIWMAVLFFGMFLFMAKFGMLGRGGSTNNILPSLNIMIIMPAMATGGMLAMRRPRMAQELLLPMQRTPYIDGVLMAIARSACASSLAVYAAVIALLAATTPEMLTLSFLAQLASLMLAAQILAFGIMVRTARHQSGGRRMAMMMLGIIPVSIAVAVGAACLGRPGVTREEFVANSLAESASALSHLSAKERQPFEARTRASAEQRWERAQPSPLGLGAAVAVTAALGIAVSVNSRRLWTNIELG